MPDTDDTRTKLVEAAAELFWKHGYTATGIAQILEAAGVLRGSLYHFFPTKEDLLIATLEWRLEMLWPDVVQPVFDRIDDPVERAFGILDGYRQLLLMTKFRLGCPIGNLALEVGDAHKKVRMLLARNFDNWVAAIRGCFESAAGRLPLDVKPEAVARFFLVVMEGAVMTARTSRSIETYDAAVTMLRDYVERLLADGSDWSDAREGRNDD